MDINYKSIGLRVREERIKHKLSQQSLAELTGLSPTNISHIERGATKLGLPSIIKIANALGVSVDLLLCGVVTANKSILLDRFMDLFVNCDTEELNILYDICSFSKDMIINRK